jgi:hypothetical protein
MGNRYTHQFNGSFKPRMVQIEGFVSIGTGGQLNWPDAYPIFPVATGATGGLAGSVQTGAPRGLMPGQATAGLPTGWQGAGFSGCVGLLGAGLDGVQRVGTGLYALKLSDDWVRLDSIQVSYQAGPSGIATGVAGSAGFSGSPNQPVDWYVVQHTVGAGNSVTTGGVTLPFFPGPNPKNTIWIQFGRSAPAELGNSDGFYIDIRVRDTQSGVQ